LININIRTAGSRAEHVAIRQQRADR